jgi:hypothetical protein
LSEGIGMRFSTLSRYLIRRHLAANCALEFKKNTRRPFGSRHTDRDVCSSAL